MTVKVIRSLHRPIITSGQVGLGQNICGPSMIYVPDWLPSRLGNFYLYFAHHRGEYIRLAFSDRIEGPWKIYEPGTISINDSEAISDHVGSPDVHVIADNKEIRMYFHSVLPDTKEQKSFVAQSIDGINFDINPIPVANFYLRALPWRDCWFGMTKAGEMYLSKNGISNFIKLPVTAFEMKDSSGNAPGDIRHLALRPITEDMIDVYFSRIGDAPESILRAKLDLNKSISKWVATQSELVLSPSLDWEGANLPILSSMPGPAKECGENALRDPAIFLHENKTYMLYSFKGESGIAMVEIVYPKPRRKRLLKSIFEIRSGLNLTVSESINDKEINLDGWEQKALVRLHDPKEFHKRLSFIDDRKPTKRIFVMGCGRSGTWLLTSLFSTMSDTQVVPIETTPFHFGLYTTNAKNLVMKRDNLSYLDIDKIPDCIGIAYIVRHPFDVLTSFNPNSEKKYHIDIDRWHGEMEAFRHLVDTKRPNAFIVRYEDLVMNASDIQIKIAQYFGLQIHSSVDNIVSTFCASPEAVLAMHGLREIDLASLYKFRKSIDRIRFLRKIRPRLGPILEWVSIKYNYDLEINGVHYMKSLITLIKESLSEFSLGFRTGFNNDLNAQAEENASSPDQINNFPSINFILEIRAGIIEGKERWVNSSHELEGITSSIFFRVTKPIRWIEKKCLDFKEKVLSYSSSFFKEFKSGYQVAFQQTKQFRSNKTESPMLASQVRISDYRFWKSLPLSTSVDIIICVHNALDDVKSCLSSVLKYSPQYSIIIVDDGSKEDTRDYLRRFSEEQRATLIRNEDALGYTRAANQGMRESKSEFLVLLNSDTVVTLGWIEKLLACAKSDPNIGLVGPLSNTASWQSIPKIEEDGDWAMNPLPDGISISMMGELVSKYSSHIYPRMSFLNGFCLLIRRLVIDGIGIFDEEMFGCGYGEENDYCLRARNAGWSLALCDNAYVYHAQSKSYSHEKRKVLAEHAGRQLAIKHGEEIISEGLEQCRWDRVLMSIRSRAALNVARENIISSSRARWEGKKVLFVLPIGSIGGGGNIVIVEAQAMMRMGVDVKILNLTDHKPAFDLSYPELNVPIIYINSPFNILEVAANYDAVIATAHFSVQWIAPLQHHLNGPTLGYYVQDFEPYFHAEGSIDYQAAMDSYTLVPDMRLFTKTIWNRDKVLAITGRDSALVGASFDVDLFYPRGQERKQPGCGPIRIVAMVRPATPRRNPEGTLALLSKLKESFGKKVDISIFGFETDTQPIFDEDILQNFNNHGQLTSDETARLLSVTDIFIDMSHYQAMGVTAMEAMSCGAIAVVPEVGGASTFARHGVNAIVADTSNIDKVFGEVAALIKDEPLRRRLQEAAFSDIAQFYPEKSTCIILETLFS